jgi:hypothetical protein
VLEVEADMGTPSYAAFVRRHRRSRTDRHAAAERIATPAPDWIDLLARCLTDAIAAQLRLRSPQANDLDEGRGAR